MRPPAESGDQKPADEGPAGDAGIDAGDGDAQRLAPLLGRENGNDDGHGGRHDHRAADPLQKAQSDNRFDRPRLRQKAADNGEDGDADFKDAPPAVDIPEAPHGNEKDGGREHVGCLHQAELHGAGAEFSADRRQGDADGGHHERHEKMRGADDEEGGRAGNARIVAGRGGSHRCGDSFAEKIKTSILVAVRQANQLTGFTSDAGNAMLRGSVRQKGNGMTEKVMELRDLHLRLTGGGGEVHILRGIDLTVGRGETLSLVGPSGAGKTSLLMVAAGLERPTAGKVRVAGADLEKLDEDGLARFRREQVGIVFQNFHLIATMTALENVALPLEFAGRADARERAAEALAAVGLAARRRHYPAQLSGGELQRVALARAFVPRPALLLADEPTGNLDRENGRRVMDLLFDLQAAHGTTLILVTHDAELAGRCNRQLHLADGRIAAGDPS